MQVEVGILNEDLFDDWKRYRIQNKTLGINQTWHWLKLVQEMYHKKITGYIKIKSHKNTHTNPQTKTPENSQDRKQECGWQETSK